MTSHDWPESRALHCGRREPHERHRWLAYDVICPGTCPCGHRNAKHAAAEQSGGQS